MDHARKYIAEFIGTGALVFLGCGTAMVVGCDSTMGTGYLLTALAFGLVIVGMAYCIGNVSGCHINPAVTIGMLISGKISITDCIGYIIAQVAGAFGGAWALALVFHLGGIPDQTGAFGSNGLGGYAGFNGGSIASALIIEGLLTFLFVLTVITSKVKNSSVAGLVIGLTLTLVHIFGIAFTGTSVNPARSLGPAIVAVILGNAEPISLIWIFIAAPLAGGIVAALVYRAIAGKQKKEEEAEA